MAMGRNADQNAAAREATVDRLVQAALEGFAEDGMARTSMAAIARRAGVSKGLAYHYFPSKDALIEAVLERRMAEVAAVAARIPEHLPARDRLAAFAHQMAADVAADPAGFRLYLRALASPDDRLAGVVSGFDRGSLAPLFATLGADDPEAEARFFTTCLLGILTRLAVSPVPTPAAPLVDRLIRTLPEAP